MLQVRASFQFTFAFLDFGIKFHERFWTLVSVFGFWFNSLGLGLEFIWTLNIFGNFYHAFDFWTLNIFGNFYHAFDFWTSNILVNFSIFQIQFGIKLFLVLFMVTASS